MVPVMESNEMAKTIDNRTEEEAEKLAREVARKVQALIAALPPGVDLRGWDDGSILVDVDYGPASERGWRQSVERTTNPDII